MPKPLLRPPRLDGGNYAKASAYFDAEQLAKLYAVGPVRKASLPWLRPPCGF